MVIPAGHNWYTHEPKDVISCQTVDLLYDQVLRTDQEVGANRPDLVIKDKVAKKNIHPGRVLPMWPQHIQSRGKESRKIHWFKGAAAENVGLWLHCYTCYYWRTGWCDSQLERLSCYDPWMPKHYHVPKSNIVRIKENPYGRLIAKPLKRTMSHRSRKPLGHKETTKQLQTLCLWHEKSFHFRSLSLFLSAFTTFFLRRLAAFIVIDEICMKCDYESPNL